jgi:predicted transcriptional regulator
MESGDSFLSLTDWQVMSAVWELGEASATSVAEKLRRTGRAYSDKTAGILLARLTRKGHLQFAVTDPQGTGRPAHIYSPVLSRERALLLQFMKFLKDHSVEAHEVEILQSLLTQSP